MPIAKTKMRTCGDCGREYQFSIAESYRYSESGLDNVYLRNIETMTCDCGTAVVFRALPTLLRVIAICFAYKPALLRGPEIRFLRSVLGRSSKDFAGVLSLSAEHFSRVENEKDPVSAPIDKIVRCRIVLDLLEIDGFHQLFDLRKFREILDQKLPASDDGLALYLTYAGPYLGVRDERIEFEFKDAA